MPAPSENRRVPSPSLFPSTAPLTSSGASFVSIATIIEEPSPGQEVSPNTSPFMRNNNPPPSSSRRSSIASSASTIVAPSTRGYRGYKSEKEYLEALRAWVEEKDYIELDTALIGWYGKKTTQDYINQPGLPPLGLREKMRRRKGEKEGRRANSVATGLGESSKGAEVADGAGNEFATTKLTRTTTGGSTSSQSSSRIFPWPRRSSKSSSSSPVERTQTK